MINFLTINIVDIILVVIVMIGIIIGIRNGYKEQIKQMLLYLVIQAEQNITGNKVGELRFSAVSTWLYEKLPMSTRVFFTVEQIAKLIDDAVKYMKEYLDKDNKNVKLGGE